MPVGWSLDAAAALSAALDAAALDDLYRDVRAGGAVLFVVIDAVAARPCGYFALRFWPAGDCEIVAAAGRLPGAVLTDACLPVIANIAYWQGATDLWVQTRRRGVEARCLAWGFDIACRDPDGMTTLRRPLHGLA